MNWEDLDFGSKLCAVLALLCLIVTLGCFLFTDSRIEPLRQYEVTLGDGTKATCVVVRGYRSAGVTCVPHVVMGPDAEDEP